MVHAKNTFHSTPPTAISRQLFAEPSTSGGFWSLICVLAFVAVLVFFFVLLSLIDSMMDSGTDATRWAGYGLAFAFLAVAALPAIAGLVLSLYSIIRRGERSLLMLIPILVGIFVVMFLVDELGGHESPRERARASGMSRSLETADYERGGAEQEEEAHRVGHHRDKDARG